MTETLSPSLFFDYQDLFLADQFRVESVFELLGSSLARKINAILQAHGVSNSPVIRGRVSPQALLEGAVYIAEGAEVGPFTYIQGPCFIGPGAEIRHGAFIRGQVYVGAKAVVGHTTEVKSSVFLDGAKAGHFAYIGDSLLGREVNLGAGTKLANLKLAADLVTVKSPDSGSSLSSGLRKMGSILGDSSQTGCNAVLSPGTLLMPEALVYPCVHFHGTLGRGQRVKHSR